MFGSHGLVLHWWWWSPSFSGIVYFHLYAVVSCDPHGGRLFSKETFSTPVFTSFRPPHSGCLGRHCLADAFPLPLSCGFFATIFLLALADTLPSLLLIGLADALPSCSLSAPEDDLPS